MALSLLLSHWKNLTPPSIKSCITPVLIHRQHNRLAMRPGKLRNIQGFQWKTQTGGQAHTHTHTHTHTNTRTHTEAKGHTQQQFQWMTQTWGQATTVPMDDTDMRTGTHTHTHTQKGSGTHNNSSKDNTDRETGTHTPTHRKTEVHTTVPRTTQTGRQARTHTQKESLKHTQQQFQGQHRQVHTHTHTRTHTHTQRLRHAQQPFWRMTQRGHAHTHTHTEKGSEHTTVLMVNAVRKTGTHTHTHAHTEKGLATYCYTSCCGCENTSSRCLYYLKSSLYTEKNKLTCLLQYFHKEQKQNKNVSLKLVFQNLCILFIPRHTCTHATNIVPLTHTHTPCMH